MSEKEPAAETSKIRADLEASVPVLLQVLAAVAQGDLGHRVELDFAEDHPAGALAQSVNSMVSALAEARVETKQALDALDQRIEVILRQQEAIRSLSVPVIEVWAGVLCIPIVGVLDSARAADITAGLLSAIVNKKARYAIIDLTGIEIMDTQSADHFLRMARAVGLLGARCALSGIHPTIARTIVHMGLDLGGLRSFRSLRDALKFCVAQDQRS